MELGALHFASSDAVAAARSSDLIVLCGPVLTILDWLDRLAPVLKPEQLVTDVGSVKGVLVEHARGRYNLAESAGFLPGHPMAGKEVSGAANADANLFDGAAWLFTETAESRSMHPASRAVADEWRGWTEKFNCCVLDLDAERHDVLCAWVSHLPQFVSTALSALLQDEFAAKDEVLPIGGRALREMTRLGASPYSMWRDVAHTNTDAIAASLLALEQRLTHLRENLKTPELREEFERANQFRPVAPTTKK
jgi:prephenate dehydrogenase